MSTTTYTSTNSRRCMSCGQVSNRCLRTCPDRIVLTSIMRLPEDSLTTAPIAPADHVTMTGVFNALEKGPQSHADARYGVRRVPVGYVALVFAGMVLIGLSLVALQFRPFIHAWLASA
jgi:hypothetical protein